MLKALDETSERLNRSHLGSPKETHVFLASPWHFDEIRNTKLSKTVPFIFTKKILNEMTERELENFKKENLVIKKIIENKNIEIKLNGYKTLVPVGKKIMEAEITMFLSSAPMDILEKIEEKIHHYLGGRKFEFHSFNFSSFIVLRNLFFNSPSFLFVDIAGEITDISLVRNEVLTDSTTFPFGKNFMIKRLMESLYKTPEEAESLISMWQNNGLDEIINNKVNTIMLSAGKEWLKHFQESLVNLSNYLLIPEKIIITLDDDVAKLFSELVLNEEFSQYTLSEKKFDVVVLKSSLLSKWFAGNNTDNSFIMLESIFISNLYEK